MFFRKALTAIFSDQLLVATIRNKIAFIATHCRFDARNIVAQRFFDLAGDSSPGAKPEAQKTPCYSAGICKIIGALPMTIPSLTSQSNEALVVFLKSLRQKENEVIADIALYLSEIDKRKSYRDIGYSSLFIFCMKALGYSEGATQRRIQAARALAKNPEVYELLKSGKLSLCALAQVARIVEPLAKTEVIAEIQGKPKLEVQRIAAKYQVPVEPMKRETVRVVAVKQPELPLFDAIPQDPNPSTAYNLSFQVDEEFMALLEKGKCKAGCVRFSEVLKRSLKAFVARKPIRKVVPKVRRGVRYIPRSVKAFIFERDQEQCSFVSDDGVQCCEKHGLQIDHVLPFARGGSNAPDNLRLVCRAHNQLLAERAFGAEFMQAKRSAKKITATAMVKV